MVDDGEWSGKTFRLLTTAGEQQAHDIDVPVLRCDEKRRRSVIWCTRIWFYIPIMSKESYIR